MHISRSLHHLKFATTAMAVMALAFAVVGVNLSAVTVYAKSTLLVPSQFPTIQSAVDSARPGDRIHILPGTYTEQVTISQDVELTGSGVDSTFIKAPATLTTGSFGRTAIVEIHGGASATMSRLTVTGPGLGSCASGTLFSGIQVWEGATLKLSFATVTHIHDTPIAECFPSGSAIRIGDRRSGSTGHATIEDVVISDYQFAGITVFSPGSTATISNNTITGVGTEAEVVNSGIDLGKGAVATVIHNTVSRNLCNSVALGCGPDYLTQTQAGGIGTDSSPGSSPGAGTVISDNDVSDNDIGISLVGTSSGCCTVSHNELRNNRFYGLTFQDGNYASSHNEISGGNVGVAVIAISANALVTLRHDDIEATSVAPIQELSCCGFTAQAIVQHPSH